MPVRGTGHFRRQWICSWCWLSFCCRGLAIGSWVWWGDTATGILDNSGCWLIASELQKYANSLPLPLTIHWPWGPGCLCFLQAFRVMLAAGLTGLSKCVISYGEEEFICAPLFLLGTPSFSLSSLLYLSPPRAQVRVREVPLLPTAGQNMLRVLSMLRMFSSVEGSRSESCPVTSLMV